MIARLQLQGVRELERLGWKIRRGASGLKVTDVFRWPFLYTNPTQIFIRYRRTGFYFEAEGDFLIIQLKLAEFFEIYFSHQVIDRVTQTC